MRYHELREAREHLENALKYVQANCGPDADKITREIGINILRTALDSVRLELKRPEQFNLDGTFRQMRMLVNA